jgi:hypothetical protein
MTEKVPDGTLKMGPVLDGSLAEWDPWACSQNGRVFDAIPARFCDTLGTGYYQVIQRKLQTPEGFPARGQAARK